MNTKPTIIVLVGITGDLAKRKLLPALSELKKKGKLPEQFRLVGVTRRDDPELFKMDLDEAADYLRLKEYLEMIEEAWQAPAQRLFYLSVAPTVALPIVKHLAQAGLAQPNPLAQTKLLLEKPFGTNLENSAMLIADIENYFSDEQVYRVDHYLQKDAVRALAAPVLTGTLMEEIKNIKEIEIFAREQIGIEGRADFYEQTGALRDFVQSHLLEVAAIMINPKDRLSVLKNLYVSPRRNSTEGGVEGVLRGQYKGYREAAGKPDSTVETFVSVALRSHDPALKDLSVVLKTGKALDRKSTDSTIFYKDGATKVISLDDSSNAYEHVFEDAMSGNKQFFVTKEEVAENWRIIAPIQEAWAADSSDLSFYDQGAHM